VCVCVCVCMARVRLEDMLFPTYQQGMACLCCLQSECGVEYAIHYEEKMEGRVYYDSGTTSTRARQVEGRQGKGNRGSRWARRSTIGRGERRESQDRYTMLLPTTKHCLLLAGRLLMLDCLSAACIPVLDGELPHAVSLWRYCKTYSPISNHESCRGCCCV